jgi:hypothetical protein
MKPEFENADGSPYVPRPAVESSTYIPVPYALTSETPTKRSTGADDFTLHALNLAYQLLASVGFSRATVLCFDVQNARRHGVPSPYEPGDRSSQLAQNLIDTVGYARHLDCLRAGRDFFKCTK